MILVTGASKGLGQFLAKHFNADTWMRGQDLPTRHYGTIIHCAHDHAFPGNNLDLIQRLFSVPCDRFIYISSVDVHKAANIGDDYALAKLRCEQFVRTSYGDHLIIRPTALLGTKPNSFTRMLAGEPLTVSGLSTFGYVRYSALLPFIDSEQSGTITVAGKVMRLQDIAEELGLAAPKFGSWVYQTAPVRATHDSMEEIREFLNDTPAH